MPISEEIKEVQDWILGDLKWDPRSLLSRRKLWSFDDLQLMNLWKTQFNDDKIDGLHFTRYKNWLGRATWCKSRKEMVILQEEGLLLQEIWWWIPKRYFKDCLDYMNIDEDYFGKVDEARRSGHLWKKIRKRLEIKIRT